MKPSERILVWLCLVFAATGIAMLFFPWSTSATNDVTPTLLPARTGVIPPLAVRRTPVQLTPFGGFEDAISDDTLYFALDTSIAYSNPPTIAQLLHELRLWKDASPFPVVDGRVGRSGAWTKNVLLDDAKCAASVQFGEAFDGFLVRTRYGIRVLTAADPGMNAAFAQGHYGQLLQVMAEIGTPLNTKVIDDTGMPGDLGDLLADAAARYSTKDEQEFTAVAFACWLQPGAEWMNRFGETHTMDDIAQRLASIEIGEGTCYGGHLPYAITVILRVNAQERIISETAQRDLESRLSNFTRILTRSQRDDGAWDPDWSGVSREPEGVMPATEELDRITCTGHHLEWFALAPPHLRPDDAVVRKAIGALDKLLINLPPKTEQSFKDMLPSSHAARALCLLRGEEPFEFWLREFTARNGEKVDIQPNREPGKLHPQ
ncbi:MAG: hypothetical protein MPJ50_18915 [Pirellulales bacterium]|nr:hypothetical protein [Pirellulales bacterium]